MLLDSIPQYMNISNCFAKWLVSFLVVGLGACANQESTSPVSPNHNQNDDTTEVVEYARGSIKGLAWNYVQGRAVIFKRNRKDYLEIRLWNEKYENPCSVPVGSILQVRMYALNTQGYWKIDPLDPFSLIPTIIFSDYTASGNTRGNLIADQGEISLTSIRNGVVTGSVRGQFTSSHVGATQVSGHFQVPLCTPLFGSY
ncbi:hypothetical protein B9G69_007685 [Bdellovibrio sp. SKB1291214]|uniref:hypothetical protein n=1 Tax=Bdellovibrio sp. SKB1291214 TaxID=1732569 RepID=UPI000B51830B|nr:hypothetical protein [Bdellovibrio sp. SKB1291214]UYL10459.1 hypothetical protein B9G69_007685 [Bdellovibrio sp. SKB1291214]